MVTMKRGSMVERCWHVPRIYFLKHDHFGQISPSQDGRVDRKTDGEEQQLSREQLYSFRSSTYSEIPGGEMDISSLKLMSVVTETRGIDRQLDEQIKRSRRQQTVSGWRMIQVDIEQTFEPVNNELFHDRRIQRGSAEFSTGVWHTM